MSFGFDPFAFIIALVAIGFAINESRRNHSIVIRFRDIAFTERMSVNENQCRAFSEFRILLRNCGISLHSPTLCLTFRGPGGRGRLNLPIKGRGDRHGEFAKGMIAEFGFKSYELNTSELEFLKELNDIPNQDVQLCLFSQGYLARTFSVGGLRDRLLGRWNRLAWRVNKMFERTVKAEDGGTLLNCPQILPIGQRRDFAITGFVRSLGTLPAAAMDGQQNAIHPESRG